MLQEAEIKFPAGYEGPTGTCDEPERALQEQHRAMKPLLCVAAPERLFGVDVDHEPVVAEPEPEAVECIVFEMQGPVRDRAVDIIDLHGEDLGART